MPISIYHLDDWTIRCPKTIPAKLLARNEYHRIIHWLFETDGLWLLLGIILEKDRSSDS